MLKYSLLMDTNKIKKIYRMKPRIKTSSMMISTLKAYKIKILKIQQITSPINGYFKIGVLFILETVKKGILKMVMIWLLTKCLFPINIKNK